MATLFFLKTKKMSYEPTLRPGAPLKQKSVFAPVNASPSPNKFVAANCVVEEQPMTPNRSMSVTPIYYNNLVGIELRLTSPTLVYNFQEDQYGKMRCVFEVTSPADLAFLRDMHAYLSTHFAGLRSPFAQNFGDPQRHLLRVSWPAKYQFGAKNGYHPLLVNDAYTELVDATKLLAVNKLAAARIVFKVWRRLNDDGNIDSGYFATAEGLEFQ